MHQNSLKPLLIKNIGQLATMEGGEEHDEKGFLKEENIVSDAWILINNGKFHTVGSEEKVRSAARALESPAEEIEANGMTAVPGFIDAHTHPVFACSRENEFLMRIRGATYMEILLAGGGILKSAEHLRKASKEDLCKNLKKHLDSMLVFGTTTIEAKSGYGLSFDSEIKSLEVIDEVSENHPVEILPTFLGAHQVPGEFREKREDYISLLTQEMIPEIARRKLAKFCDVFCDTGAFTVEESRVILTTARKFGLGLRIHADELAPSGGSKLAAELGTLSADHLVEISEQGIKALKKAGVVPVLLPGTSFHLGKQSFAPARKIIKAGLPVALSTDFNPGTSMTENLQTIMTIACVYMRMTPYEALRGVTINAAKSLGIDKNNGSVHPGKKADLLLLDVPNINYIPYHFGVNHVHTVIKNGRVAVSDRKKPLFFSG